MLLIGSRALKFRRANFPRESKDYDFIAYEHEYDCLIERLGDRIVTIMDSPRGKTIFAIGYGPIEIEIAGTLRTTAHDILDQTCNQLPEFHDPIIGDHAIAHLDDLYCLKMSHRYLKNSPHFRKTLDDILFMRKYVSGISNEDREWYQNRMKETYNYVHPVLNQTKDKFFSDDGINYIFDHDSIHEAVKTFDKPAFHFIRIEGKEVLCSKDKFMNSPEEIKLATVLEECYVLALERCIIPQYYGLFWDGIDKETAKRAFLIALEKVCTSISSGWWREYAWENYYQVRSLYDFSYVQKFLDAIYSDKIPFYRKDVA